MQQYGMMKNNKYRPCYDAVLQAFRENQYGLEISQIKEICQRFGVKNYYTVIDSLSTYHDVAGDAWSGYYLLSEREKYLKSLREKARG